MTQPALRTVVRFAIALAGVVAVTGALLPVRHAVNEATVALAFLVVVLFVATAWGQAPALLAAVAGMLLFNFFFLPPYYTLTIADPQNLVALGAFVATAVTAGELSARARRRAQESEMRRTEIERLYASLRDAFDRASAAEAARQSEQLKSTLLDAVTHDLRTPLTSIKASVSTLLDDARGEMESELSGDDRREMLDVIDEETDRLDRLIGNIVEIARIEAGQIGQRRQWTPVGDIVTRALEPAALRARGHAIEVDVSPDLPSLYVDGRALADALHTVVENAVKFSPAGSTVRVRASEGNTGEVRIAVEDDGPGVPAELRERVFEKFYRASTPGVEATRGTGMGLAIVRGVVAAHGGRAWIESSPSGGARVVLEIPVGDPESE